MSESNAPKIFEYVDQDGQSHAIDPFEALDRLCFECAQIERDFDELCRQSVATKLQTDRDGTPVLDKHGQPVEVRDILTAYEPAKILRAVTCEVFGVKPFDPATKKGLLSNQVEALLDSFLVFCQSQKKS